jgi:protein ImuB
MPKRFVSIWFPYLKTDRWSRRNTEWKELPFVLSTPDHGRMMISAINHHAHQKGIQLGMAVADARVIIPDLLVMNDDPLIAEKTLLALAEWLIRFTPVVGIDGEDGLLLDVTGCAHLWGGEEQYLTDMLNRLKGLGYFARAAMADTIGAAYAMCRFGATMIVEPGKQSLSLLSLPPESLRIDNASAERLEKLGLRQIGQFINMPRTALRRRFGYDILKKLDQALGREDEMIMPVHPIEAYQERLPCMEPIATEKGIAIALERSLDALCGRLKKEEKGLRVATFKCYRVDNKIETISIGTNRPSSNIQHLFKLFELKIDTIEPALGIELFTLDASKVEELNPVQEKLWEEEAGIHNNGLAELLDRIEGRIGPNHIYRYLPDEHHWPERSYKIATELYEHAPITWQSGKPRPLQVLAKPALIEVTAPIPDYPPMLFRYKGRIHKVIKADGPERIEQEWWLQEGLHRDYYQVEDEEGKRYWLFRAGHYNAEKTYQWFLHGFFA